MMREEKEIIADIEAAEQTATAFRAELGLLKIKKLGCEIRIGEEVSAGRKRWIVTRIVANQYISGGVAIYGRKIKKGGEVEKKSEAIVPEQVGQFSILQTHGVKGVAADE